jgi:signal transduction histidine kinase
LVVLALVAILVMGSFRRRDPVPVFVALAVGSAVVWWASGADAWGLLGACAVFFVEAYEERVRLRQALVVGGSLVLLVLQVVTDDSWLDLVVAAASLAGVIGWGRGVRTERLYRAGLLQRAEDAERERDLRAEQAVAQERARIARDIHDVVSHSLAVVVVQASGAQRIAERQPERAREALGVIADTARGALTEMRAMLQVLRSGDGSGREDAPSPGLPDIEGLVSDVSGRGLPVELSTSGAPYSLGPGRELALYRVAQESLTNALKHGGRAEPTTLAIHYDPGNLVVEVVNPLPDAAGAVPVPVVPGSGSGLAGMRERLALYGGTLDAGVQGGRYRVRAGLPRTAPMGAPLASAPDPGGTP